MKTILLLATLAGGLLSFHASASFSSPDHLRRSLPSSFLMSRAETDEKLTDAQCQAKPPMNDYTMTNVFEGKPDKNGVTQKYAIYKGCIYQSSGICVGSNNGTEYFCNWIPVSSSTPSDGDDKPSDKPDDKPTDKPDDNKPDTPDSPGGDSGNKPDEPELPDYSKPSQPDDMKYVQQMLSYIAQHTPDELYTAFGFKYDVTHSWTDNRAVYGAYIVKIKDVIPPTYKSYDVLRSILTSFQTIYKTKVPPIQGVPEKCVSGHWIVMPDDCVPYRSRMQAYSSYIALPDAFGPAFATGRINDPNYASYSDYQKGITRCDRDPTDASCNNKPDEQPGDGNTGNNPDNKPGGDGGNKPGDKPDTTPPGGGTVLPPGGDTVPPPGVRPCVGDDCKDGAPFDYERMGNVTKDRLSENYDDSVTRSLAQKNADASFSGVTDAQDKLSDGAAAVVSGSSQGDLSGGQLSKVVSGTGSSPLLDRFKIQDLPSPSQCRPFVFGAGQVYEFTLDCDKMNFFKQIFAFILYFWTFITLYETFVSLPSKNKG
ncbi:TPA: hypothetical protein I8Y21_005850 [Klebsiella oxytoca]|uniref:Attachment protein G3P N-terminal domain-containing protein n=1 Tax=Klebsiella oxytoca TaxID=571 RepID=A0AAN5RGN0_KLEOX|nr:hypothetical protein [Klebsiella oxytoca]